MWTYNYTSSSDELYHHGIKGQRWGVRRFQNKDGSYTPAGKKRYSEHDESEKSKQKGLTDKQKKCIAIGAAAAVALLAVYGGYKISNSRSFDRTIGMGRDFYRQGSKLEATKGLNDLVYATFKKSDAEKYKKMIPDGVGYKIKSSRKTKIAGIKKSKKIYEQLIKTNKEFAKHYGEFSYEDFNGSLGVANRLMIDQNIKLNDTYLKPFFDALVSKGYNAVMDTQDKFAKFPVILLNNSDAFNINR